MFLRCPDGSLKPYEPESFHKLCPSGVLPDNFLPYSFFEDEKWMKGYALEKRESTLNFVLMPMNLMWNLSWKLLEKLVISWIILPVSLNWIPCNYGFGHIDIPWFLFSDKLKYLSFADQYTCQPCILLYLRVLPSGILTKSSNHVAYYEPSSSIIPHRFQCFLVLSC